MDVFLQFCVNLYIVFYNSFVIMYNSIFEISFIRLFVMMGAIFAVYKLVGYEGALIKEPALKPTRKKL